MSPTELMQRCLDLAILGIGKVSPNPMVGALVVWNQTIIGEGWHQQYGQAHAEVNAIREALHYLCLTFPEGKTYNSHSAFGQCTLYVNLEPCTHFGKTPPCSDLILFHGIGAVVVGCLDSNPLVAGHGIEKLKAGGVDTVYGVLENECRFFNRRFFTSLEKRRPYIILKWAETQSRIIAPSPHRKFWITSPISQMVNHKWRTEEDAILIGKNTALWDNPSLSSRFWLGKNPKRVVLDWNLETPKHFNLYNEDADSYIFNGLETKTEGNIHFLEIESRDYSLQYMLFQLYLNNIQSLIVEGGRNILDQFIALELWDEARIIQSSHWGLPEPGVGLEMGQKETVNQSLNIDKNVPGLQSPILPDTAYLFSKTLVGEDIILKFYAIIPKNPIA